jgi:hypothetical protein
MFYNEHRPHQGIANVRPLAPIPEPITEPHRLTHLNIHRRDRPDGISENAICRLTCPDDILGIYTARRRRHAAVPPSVRPSRQE